MRRLLLLLVTAITPRLPAQVSAFHEAKARELLRSRLSCLGCHELDGDGGRSAPSLTTVARRRSAEYIRAIIRDPQAVLPGVGMPAPGLDSATRELLAAFLSRGARSGAVSVPASEARETRVQPAAALYARWCATCHGATGRGDGPNARHLPVQPAVHASAQTMRRRSDDALFDAISGGGLVMGKSARMPAFGATLSPAEIRALVAYIRALCACTGPPWSLDGR